MFGIFLYYFSTLITNLKSFFYLVQIFIPHFGSPATLVEGPHRKNFFVDTVNTRPVFRT